MTQEFAHPAVDCPRRLDVTTATDEQRVYLHGDCQPGQQEPYWRVERYLDGAGQWHDRWQPSNEMTYLLGCLLSTQHDIEGVTMQRPTLVLLPADRTPLEARAGGVLMGLPFVVSDQVTEMSLVYPVRARAKIQFTGDGAVQAGVARP